VDSCVLKMSADKAFFKAETPDATWPALQVSEDGLNFLYDADAPEDPLYLAVTEDYEGTDGPKANTIYLLVPLVTTVVPNCDLDEEPNDEADETKA
jgi:hypothetical protein